MPVQTKFKIWNQGARMDAGQFVCDADKVTLKSNSEAHVFDIEEVDTDKVSFTSEGVIRAGEFREV